MKEKKNERENSLPVLCISSAENEKFLMSLLQDLF